MIVPLLRYIPTTGNGLNRLISVKLLSDEQLKRNANNDQNTSAPLICNVEIFLDNSATCNRLLWNRHTFRLLVSKRPKAMLLSTQ